jgi:VIT1/CCC1 family predicted Fe2+/Mn2+ transporter
MITDLSQSSHAHAARIVPIVIALVNGLAPLFISLLILLPLWLYKSGVVLPMSPLIISVFIAMTVIFLLGVFLSRVSGMSWWRSGIRTLMVGILTAALIFVFVG